jgi:hypothetical protein
MGGLGSKMTQFKGFGPREETPREMNELERYCGARFVEEEKEPYPGDIGKLRTLHLRGAALFGVYRGMTERGQIVLLPHVVYEFEDPLTINKENTRHVCYWATKVPKHVGVEQVEGMDPCRIEFLQRMIPSLTFADVKEYLDK